MTLAVIVDDTDLPGVDGRRLAENHLAGNSSITS